MNKTLQEHRKHLVEARQKAFEDFDKTLIALAGGALGVSITFVKDLFGPGEIVYKGSLFAAWIFWSLSLIGVLASYFLSQRALEKAISQIDTGSLKDSPGGLFSTLTKVLNGAGGQLFICGLILFIIFVSTNLEVLKMSNQNKAIPQPAAPTNSQPSPSPNVTMVVPTPTTPNLPGGSTHGYVPASPPPTSAPKPTPTSKPRK